MELVQAANANTARRIERPMRAPTARRVVMVEPDRIAIARSVAGVFMRISLAPSAYRGVLLSSYTLTTRLPLGSPSPASRSRSSRASRRDGGPGCRPRPHGAAGRSISICRRWSNASKALSSRSARPSAPEEARAPTCADAAAAFVCAGSVSSRAARSDVPNSASRSRASANCSPAPDPGSERGAGREIGSIDLRPPALTSAPSRAPSRSRCAKTFSTP